MDRLLTRTDPDPVEVLNPDSQSPLVLVCEHAGRAVPERLNLLGLSDAARAEHVAWDIGAAAVTRELAQRLNVSAVMQRYSRLTIDCNRPPQAHDAMPSVSHGVTVPANQALTRHEKQQRVEEIFTPFDTALKNQLSSANCRFAFSIHSFTPTLGNQIRPWDIGFLFREDSNTSNHLSTLLHKAHPTLTIGMNQPYTVDDESDWFVPQYGERLGLAHSLLEIRNDHVSSKQGQLWWAETLTTLFTQFMEQS